MSEHDALEERAEADVRARLAGHDLRSEQVDALVRAADGVLAAIDQADHLSRTMAPQRIATLLVRGELEVVRDAVSGALDDLDEEIRDAAASLAWLPPSFDAAMTADFLGLSEARAGDLLTRLLDHGLLRSTAGSARRFRLPHPVRPILLERHSEHAEAAGEFLVGRAEEANEALWGADGPEALAGLRRIASDADRLVSGLLEADRITLAARLVSALDAEPFGSLPFPDAVGEISPDRLQPALALRFRCAVAMARVFRGDTDLDELISIASESADVDETILVVTTAELAIQESEGAVELPEELLLTAVIERLEDPSRRAFAQARQASIHLARGLPTEARELLSTARVAVDEHQVVLLDGYVCDRLAQCWFLEGRAQEARAGFEDAVRRYRTHGQTMGAVKGSIDLGANLIELGEYDEALKVLKDAIAMARDDYAGRLRLAALLMRGMAQQGAGRLPLAEEDFQTALALAERYGEQRNKAAAQLHLAELQLARDDWEGAWERLQEVIRVSIAIEASFLELYSRMMAVPVRLVLRLDPGGALDRARTLVSDGGFGFLWAAIDVLHALVASWRSGEEAELESALESLSDTTEERMIGQLARAAWEKRPTERDTSLVVHREGLWFEGSEGFVDLRRRKAPRIILRTLAEARDTENPVLSMEALFEEAWPGESATASSAAQRVYTAVWTLRQMGLEQMLEKRTEGYLFSEEVEIVWSDDVTVFSG